MKILMLIFMLTNIAMAQIRFVPTHPGPNTPAKPILGVLNGGLADTINQISIINQGVGYASQKYHSYAPSVICAYLKILSPGVEATWYADFWIGDESCSIGAENGDQISRSGNCNEKDIDSSGLLNIGIRIFSARDWSTVGSDVGGSAYDLSYLKNKAKVKDTLDVRLILVCQYVDTSSQEIVKDSVSYDCRVEYNRGQLIPGLKIKNKSRSKLQAIAGGWKVPAGGRWTLRNLQGREIPLRQEPTNDGVMLLPQGLRGVGVLSGPKGQASKVHSLGGN